MLPGMREYNMYLLASFRGQGIIDGGYQGVTPGRYQSKKPAFSRTIIKLQKKGYQSLNTTIRRNERINWWAVLGSGFLVLPLGWIMDYKPEHTYELEQDTGTEDGSGTSQAW